MDAVTTDGVIGPEMTAHITDEISIFVSLHVPPTILYSFDSYMNVIY